MDGGGGEWGSVCGFLGGGDCGGVWLLSRHPPAQPSFDKCGGDGGNLFSWVYRNLQPSVPFVSLFDCEDFMNPYNPMFSIYRIKSRIAVSDMDPVYGQTFPQDQFFFVTTGAGEWVLTKTIQSAFNDSAGFFR